MARYILRKTNGARVTFEVFPLNPNSAVVVTDKERGLFGKETLVSGKYGRDAARVVWARLVKDRAVRVECVDEDGHDGQACSCAEVVRKTDAGYSVVETVPSAEAARARVLELNGDQDAYTTGYWLRTATGQVSSISKSKTAPAPGTWADIARGMVRDGLMSGDEADEWKDQMKEADL